MLPQANLTFIGWNARFEHAPRNACTLRGFFSGRGYRLRQGQR